MQGNAHDEEYEDPHGECRHEIRALQAKVISLRESLTELLDACVEDFGPGDDNDEDDEAVGGGLRDDGSPDPMAITFGMLKRAASTLRDNK